MPLTFIHISDTHIHKNPTFTGDFVSFSSRPMVKELVRQINALPFHVDFVLHTGDIMTDPEHDLDYVIARELLEQINIPVHYVPGNHDRVQGVQRVLLGRQDAELTPRLDYTFEAEGVQIICLDSTLRMSAAGLLQADQLRWLDNLFMPEDMRPLVVALHHHPIPSGSPWLDELVLLNGLELHTILLKARHRLRGVFYGHIHEDFTTTRDGISYHAVRSSWFQTRTWPGQDAPFNDPHHDPGYNVVTITEHDTFIRRYRFHMPLAAL
ncbi:MAG: metallophosphoesterase [bacterium]|nr:metallophosphoesterase [bacterium]